MDSQTPEFDLDALVVKLRAAAAGPDPRAGVKALIEQAVSDPERFRAATPDFAEDEIILFEDDSVSIWLCRFQPGQAVPPHDHRMSAIIGLYDGIESNVFFENDPDSLIRESGEVRLAAGDVLQIGPSAIHAVRCVSDTPCQGIYVYLGRLTTVPRSLFDLKNARPLKFTDTNYARLTAAV